MQTIADITYWQRKSTKVISETLKGMGISLKKGQKFSYRDSITIENAISKAYPFGKRAKTPYRIWLKTVNLILTEIGIRGAKNRSFKGSS